MSTPAGRQIDTSPAPAVSAINVQRFLRCIFGPDLARAHIAAFREDPANGRWAGGLHRDIGHTLTPDRNQYVCVSVFREGKEKRALRQRALLDRTCAVMIDDIGTKVQFDAIKLPWTALVETSPGNFQAWYALHDDADARNAERVELVISELIRSGLAADGKDPGMKGCTRYGRLPGGINNKAKVVAANGGKPFAVMLKEIADRKYTLREFAKGYGIDPDAIGRRASAPAAVPHFCDEEVERFNSALLDALEDADCAPEQHPDRNTQFNIICPWFDEHTGEDTSGTAIILAGHLDLDGKVHSVGGFKCHHGHCADRHLPDLLQWLRDMHGKQIFMPSGFDKLPANLFVEDRHAVIARLSKEGKIETTKRGTIVGTENDVLEILRTDPFYQSDRFCLKYDSFADRTQLRFDGHGGVLAQDFPSAAVPKALTTKVMMDMRVTHGITTKLREVVQAVLELWLLDHTWDSAKEWGLAQGPKWDKVSRLDSWLVKYASAPDTPYVRKVSELVFLAAARRALFPEGAKFDHMLILEGPQGIGKSRLIAALTTNPKWSSELSFDPTEKKSELVMHLTGKLFVEVAELAALRRAPQEALKAMLSREVDRTRLPYGLRPDEFPRRCVLIGTTNEEQYLHDDTGNRRYWPVKLSGAQIDIKGFVADREQLWSEACHRALTESALYLKDEIAQMQSVEAEQRHVIHANPLLESVQRLAEVQASNYDHYVRTALILESLEIPKAQWAGKQKEIVSLLRGLGYVRPMTRSQNGQWLPYRPRIDGVQAPHVWMHAELARERGLAFK
jgi:predicted P-loop ATPase